MVRKVTFTLDEQTIRRLETTAERLRKPKSQVVREAVAEYHDRSGRLSEAERQQLLGVLDTVMSRKAQRSADDVEQELEGIRAARRAGGRKGVHGR